MAFSRNLVAVRRRSPLRRAAALAVVAACAVCLWSFSALSAFATVLDRPVVAEDTRVTAQGAERKVDKRNTRKEEDKGLKNSTMLQTGFTRKEIATMKPVSVAPPMATCFVEIEAEGRPVLEEWLLRGESENVAAFRSWRQGSLIGDGSVRCVENTHKAVDAVLCLECVAQAESLLSGSVATVEATIIDTFVDAQQCLSSTVGGMGFCKSGQVALPM